MIITMTTGTDKAWMLMAIHGVDSNNNAVDNNVNGVDNNVNGEDNNDNGVDNYDNGVENNVNDVDNHDNGIHNNDNGVDNNDSAVLSWKKTRKKGKWKWFVLTTKTVGHRQSGSVLQGRFRPTNI